MLARFVADRLRPIANANVRRATPAIVLSVASQAVCAYCREHDLGDPLGRGWRVAIRERGTMIEIFVVDPAGAHVTLGDLERRLRGTG